MRLVFSGSVPKHTAYAEANEDHFKISANENRIALCDGASESFNSKLWAELVADAFVSNPRIGPEWLKTITGKYVQAHDFHSMSWSQQSAFERGSFSTLLGLEFQKKSRRIKVVSIGDCIALLFNGKVLVDSWPFDDIDSFKARPTLLSTIAAYNEFLDKPAFKKNLYKVFKLAELDNPILLCMTDALGEWALDKAINNDDQISELLDVNSSEALTELVLKERATNSMRIDDSTLLKLTF
ncbi:hypothetical protein [Rheinheimera hassiensis]|uniref:hypothetical protein n=1 Tax=Rheinheimera hassiensis TaxID=1193627 RepID=UPI001F05C0C5|nr:hypothetical protein [Rheinheimera hassiensis]